MLNRIKKAIEPKKTTGDSIIKEGRKVELLGTIILLEAAHSDFECSEKELDHVIDTIKAVYKLPHEYVEELLEFAHTERGRSVDLYPFIRELNEKLNREEKRAVLESVWHIICADGQIDKHEEHFARRLADLLWLEHKDFIDAKLKAKKK
jgi:uncharacterized tellurite resistance protein B-like protein